VSAEEPRALTGRADRVRELERLALERLPSLQLADGIFCHEVSGDGKRTQGRSLRYTLIVLIGLLRAEEHGLEPPVHIGALRSRVLSELDSEELTAGDIGLALWAESRADGTAVGELVGALGRRIGTSRSLDSVMTMEVSWILTGLVECGSRGELGDGERILHDAREQLVSKRNLGKGILTHVARGPRRRFPHFADQIYGLLALSQLARVREDASALELTAALADRLIELQMDNGAWPWIYDPVRGTVVEPYELYSIHQDSMAMMGLHGASQATGEERFHDAAVRGLDWNYGGNELGVEMFDREARVIHRSIRRKQRFHRAAQARNAAAAYLRAKPRAADPDGLEVNRTMRPYHLGWILEAWAGREELAGEEG
jgi:hypothetical protein